jgi:DNA-directed RNA polymerase specialized sigma subunit
VSTPEQIAAQAAALAEVRANRIERDKAAEHVAALNERLRQSILAALDIGAAPKDIAAAADVSHQRISQISRGQ